MSHRYKNRNSTLIDSYRKLQTEGDFTVGKKKSRSVSLFGYGLWAVTADSVSLDISGATEPAEITIVERFTDLICEIPSHIVTAKVRSIAVGAAHLLLLTETGSVFCRGDNRFGQLGLGKEVKECFDLEPIQSLQSISIDQVAASGMSFLSSSSSILFLLQLIS